MKTCKIEGCNKPKFGRGWCSKHYAKWRKYGDPTVVRQNQAHGLCEFERFWMNVSVSEGCWEWTAGKDPNGYGRFAIKETPNLAHRVSWRLAHGEDPGPKHVLHSCDNPGCVRPSHLRLGTHDDNMADKMSRGRHVYGTSKGEAHGCSKLTAAQVLEIRASADTGVNLSKRFGVSTTQISDIRNRRVWKHL
ncbi:HNH endonuclease [Salipiger bermudensis]|uniref:HNH endonuclease signature motif containing protein n=1 Tax=Salipiger bermudensis TaxID=344736 RepID=UPI001C99FF41|nr:HNH endonuclease [Salipiger bermudensis]